jgi:hypothetical protein
MGAVYRCIGFRHLPPRWGKIEMGVPANQITLPLRLSEFACDLLSHSFTELFSDLRGVEVSPVDFWIILH